MTPKARWCLRKRFLRWCHQMWRIMHLDLTHQAVDESIALGGKGHGRLVVTWIKCTCGQKF